MLSFHSNIDHAISAYVCVCVSVKFGPDVPCLGPHFNLHRPAGLHIPPESGIVTIFLPEYLNSKVSKVFGTGILDYVRIQTHVNDYLDAYVILAKRAGINIVFATKQVNAIH